MSNEEQNHDPKHHAARHTFQDILGTLRLRGRGESIPPPEIGIGQPGGDLHVDGRRFAELLEQNFARLDPNKNGITKEELAQAIISKESYSDDEYVMLLLLGKYFDTIANMCEDEEGAQTVITRMDKDVLNQFLLNSNLSLDDLHKWRTLAQNQEAEQ